MTRFRTLVTTFTLAAVLAAPLLAQQLSQSVQVTVVEVPVTVVDRGGNAVTGLQRNDFSLYDDGRKVSISSFEKINFDELTAKGTPTSPLPAAATRNFMLLFDLTDSSPGTIDRAREAAKTFVESEITKFDRVAVGTYSVDHGLDLLASFTTNRDVLLRAIETLGVPKYFKVGDPLFLSVTDLAQPTDATNNAALRRQDLQERLKDRYESFNRAAQKRNDAYMKERLSSELSGFAAIARALDGLRGQKEIILLSEGFDAKLVQGRETTEKGTKDDREALLLGQIEKVDSDQRYGSTSSARDLSDMAKIFRRSDVVMHAIDIKGLRSDVDAQNGARAKDGARRPSNEGLFLLTRPTGGTVFKNTNDLDATFNDMLRQQRVTYVLGYQIDAHGSPGKYHQLEVKVSGQPFGTRVHARTGYYEPGPTRGLGALLSTAQMMVNDVAVDDVPMALMAAPFPSDGERAQVPVILQIDGQKLVDSAEGPSLSGDLFLYAFGPGNEVEDYSYQRIDLDLTKVGDRLGRSGIRYYETFSLAPGKYTIKALLRMNESGYESFRKQDLVVPDFRQTTVLSPVIVATAGDWIMLRRTSHAADEAPYPFMVGSNSFIPSPEHRVAKDGHYKVALFAYHISPLGLGLSAKVRNSKGEVEPADVKLIQRTLPRDDGSMQLLLDFTPADLSAGDWDLEVTLTPGEGEPRTANLPIVVERGNT